MSSYSLSLSTNSMSTVRLEDEIELFDRSNLTLKLSAITEEKYPLYLKIDWGDGELESYDNKIFKNYRVDSIIPEILYGKQSYILQDYTHTYNPPQTSLYKMLTAQVLIEYPNYQKTWIKIPIKIRSGGFFDTIENLRLVNTEMKLGSGKKYHLATDKDGFLIEIEN